MELGLWEFYLRFSELLAEAPGIAGLGVAGAPGFGAGVLRILAGVLGIFAGALGVLLGAQCS